MASIVQPIIARAAREGDLPALRFRDAIVSYRQLVDAALAFARVVTDLAPRSDRIAVEATRTPETFVAILGILCAGKAYVPLNPSDPGPRLRTILAASQASHVVAACPERVLGAVAQLAPPRIDRTSGAPAPFVDPKPEDEAYVFFTSGSTGGPKGVPLTHRNASAFVDWATATFALSRVDRVAGYSPLFFDLSIFDLFVTLGSGASVGIVPDDVVKIPQASIRYLADLEVSVLYTVPSALESLLKTSDRASLATVRILMLAGEPFPTGSLDAVRRAAPAADLYNLYGPIEANVVSAYALPGDVSEGDPVPIGSATSSATLAILRGSKLVVEPGVVGEIVVTGPSVFAGYLDSHLLVDPFIQLEGKRWYRTGDLGTVDREGSYWYRGRDDDRVKVRGFLIELAEVEAVLSRTPGIARAAVAALDKDTSRARIHAFVEPDVGADAGTVRPRDVSAWCARFLPRYMWPDDIHVVSALPLGPTGKVDRVQLVSTARRANA